VGQLSPEWKKVDAKGDLTFRSERGGTIYANVECDKTDDAPLDVLTNHLLFGVDIKDERRKEITLAGRKALRTRVQGEVDGVPVHLDTVVLMKNGCTYDLALIAAPERFAEVEEEFDRFVAGFETIENRKVRDPDEDQEAWACSVVPC
jgi:hypothetical protein